MAYDFNEIVSNFNVDGKLLSCERYGEGLINETYLAIIEQDGKPVNFIVQKINNKLFKNVEKLMNNIKLVTEFNRKKIIERGGNPDRESLTLIYAKDGKPYVENKDGFFRMYVFITDAFAPDKVEKPE
ncbi:MAG: mucin desulfatase, partial [Clostridia bacterium]|nr:mucin desulfatase [Clostridia bacterium]